MTASLLATLLVNTVLVAAPDVGWVEWSEPHQRIPVGLADHRYASVPVDPPYVTPPVANASDKIDQLVFARLKELHIEPAELCSDEVFLRRVYLDVLGTLPTAAEARAFLAAHDPHKRRVLIDQVLERDERADYWALKWGDVLRIKAEFPINLWPHAAQGYHHWLRTALRENEPYDRLARELLTASGSNFRQPAVNFYRTVQSRQPQAIAQAVALVLMGARAEKWPPERLAGMGAFFARISYKPTGEWKEEIVFFDPARNAEPVPGTSPKVAGASPKSPVVPSQAMFPDGTTVRLPADRDPRELFATWLVDAKNPWFARNLVNRVWYWLLGRGIIQEPDDIRADNPPVNPKLLAFLEQDFIASHYDLKHLYRLILNSRTYQLSSTTRSKDPAAEANFAYYPLRRLEAEVLIDALCQITGTSEKYSSAIPEPYTFLPEGHRAVMIPDGSISSSFLETFGRPPRDTGLESERTNRITAAQRLHLLNSTHVQRKLEQSPNLQQLLQGGKKLRDVVDELYLAIFSRYPTETEWKTAERYASTKGMSRRDAVIDIAWALINSAEFLYRH